MTTTLKTQRPVVLVLEGLSGASACVRRAGGSPITVNPRDIAKVDAALKQPFDALLLTGGGDVDPRLYGAKPHKRTYGVSETRDLTEWCALERAKELGVPVLGICRGSQIMAVHNGGKLRQHVSGHRSTEHLVFAEPSGRFKRNVGNAMHCVSLHHQVVKRHGRGFRVAARNREGMIEAIESRDGRCLGVQFHPEMDYFTNPGSQLIFRWLIVEAGRRAGITPPKALKVKPRPAPAKGEGKHRQAGERRYPRGRSPVTVSWLCPMCAMRFDKLKDREDHIWHLHDQKPLFDTAGTPPFTDFGLEPPPGHPDWEVTS